MKKVLAITLMLLLLATAAMCAENNWRVVMKADNGSGGSPANGVQLGVYSSGLEGLDTQDGTAYTGLSGDTPGTAMHVVGAVPGADTNVYGKNIKALTPVPPAKTWDFFVAANVNSTASVIRLYLVTVSSTTLPTATVGATSVKYQVKMLDNKGIEGAPAVGTIWDVPIATAHSATVPFWTAPVNLPVIKLSQKANSAMIAEGYRLQLIQTEDVIVVTPEPSSLIALGTGLVGLVGFATRRRRA